MNVQQALNVFNLSGDVSEKEIKSTFKKLALKFHPDRNPLGVEMMKMINTAYTFLLDNIDKINTFQDADTARNYCQEIEDVLNVLNSLSGLDFEIIGNWVWVGGNTKENKEILKENGFKWHRVRKLWFYRPDEYKTYKRKGEYKDFDSLRAEYGTSGKSSSKGRKSIQ